MSQVQVPILNDQHAQAEINQLALSANSKRTQAYEAEEEAIRIVNDEVIYAE